MSYQDKVSRVFSPHTGRRFYLLASEGHFNGSGWGSNRSRPLNLLNPPGDSKVPKRPKGVCP